MEKLENDTRSIELTSISIENSDKDISTIKALNRLATKLNLTLVITGGYAVEAHCGGKIIRPHGDIDVRLLLTKPEEAKQVLSKVMSLIRNEKTNWRLRKHSNDGIEYLEEIDREFFEKRKFELKMRMKDQYRVDLDDRTLVSSKGGAVKVKVVALSDLVASKVHKFYVVRNGIDAKKDRHTSISDYFDLKRLFELERLDRKKVIKVLADSPELSKLRDARSQAENEYNYTVNLIAEY